MNVHGQASHRLQAPVNHVYSILSALAVPLKTYENRKAQSWKLNWVVLCLENFTACSSENTVQKPGLQNTMCVWPWGNTHLSYKCPIQAKRYIFCCNYDKSYQHKLRDILHTFCDSRNFKNKQVVWKRKESLLIFSILIQIITEQ